MRARAALMRHVRAFFELEAIGIFTVGDVAYRPAHPAEEAWREGRRYAYGREREIVELDFADYSMELLSPLEAPPLGIARLRWPGGEISGPIDETTFAKFGKVIRGRAGVQPERTMA